MSADVTGLIRGEGAEGVQERPPPRGKFSKTRSKILVHSEQIVKGGGGHRISPLCTVLKLEHQSVI